MGAVVSSLLAPLKTVKMVVGTFMRLESEFSDISRRAKAPATLPHPPDIDHSTGPFWLRDPPFPDLAERRSPQLAARADIVIIGSGITGAATARSVLLEAAARRRRWRAREGSDDGAPELPRVVVLESRELCSGATGRNGGHIKAAPYELLGRLVRKGVAEERAVELVRFQLRHLDLLVGLCRAGGDDRLAAVAECREVETVDFFVGDEQVFEQAKADVHLLRRLVPECKIRIWTAEEAVERFSASGHVLGALSYKAGALWPYRFVTAVWQDLLDEFPDNVFIETGTSAMAIETSPDNPSGTSEPTGKEDLLTHISHLPFLVTTPRGTIRTRHVVHATNAYTNRLVPGLRGKMGGILAHMSAQRPLQSFKPGLPDGGRSWSIIYDKSGFDYVTQRPAPLRASDQPQSTTAYCPGELMLGGGFTRSPKQGADMIGIYDDSRLEALTVAHLAGIVPAMFTPGHDGGNHQLAISRVWSGVVCVVGDLLPLVGRLDERVTGRQLPAASSGLSFWKRAAPQATPYVGEADRPGEWIAAGFNGDGMVWAWLCGTALGIMLLGGDDSLEMEGERKGSVHDIPGRPHGRLADWFPHELYSSYDRIKKLDILDLASDIL